MVADQPDTETHVHALRDGSEITIGPMGPQHRMLLLQFARSLSDHDLLFLRRDITVPAEVDDWIADLEAGRSYTQVALRDGVLLGYAAVSRSNARWRRHVAELRVLTAPSTRGQGLGRLLTNDAFRLAVDIGIEKMVAQMTPDQEAAISVFYRLGFEQEARLLAEVKDRSGRKHDLIVLSHDVSRYQEARRAHEASSRQPE